MRRMFGTSSPGLVDTLSPLCAGTPSQWQAGVKATQMGTITVKQVLGTMNPATGLQLTAEPLTACRLCNHPRHTVQTRYGRGSRTRPATPGWQTAPSLHTQETQSKGNGLTEYSSFMRQTKAWGAWHAWQSPWQLCRLCIHPRHTMQTKYGRGSQMPPATRGWQIGWCPGCPGKCPASTGPGCSWTPSCSSCPPSKAPPCSPRCFPC